MGRLIKSGVMPDLIMQKGGKILKEYVVSSARQSIVQPEMLNVMLYANGHFVGSVRMPCNFDKELHSGHCMAFENKFGSPVAYSVGCHMYLKDVPVDKKAAKKMFGEFAGICDLSLEKIRFYMALRRALNYFGEKPALSPSANIMRLVQIQEKTK